jgi:hypothetical protein
MINQSANENFNEGFAVTPSDSVDIKDDIGNLSGTESVFLHNVAAGGTVKIMPAGQNPATGYNLTGSSGTANITINGTAYLATYASSLTVTATDFVASHKVALKALGITVISNGIQLRFSGAVGGSFAIANVSGDLSGTALAALPVTIYIAQGATALIAAKRVYNSTPTPPAGMIGYYSGSGS